MDILLVVDNSGSMAEEQETLARSIYNNACPIQSLIDIPAALRDPSPELVKTLSEVCGFSQILAAFNRDFRIGIITTDVNACDNLIPASQGGEERGQRPQRGCLQPFSGTSIKVITRADLDVDSLFRGIIENAISDPILVGSPYERAFDAVDALLENRPFVDSCKDDRDLLIREDAELLIIFVTDEDDCSHDRDSTFPDETVTVCEPTDSLVTQYNPALCYTKADAEDGGLTPVAVYADRWRKFKDGKVRVAVLAGLTSTGAPGGCRYDGESVVDACFPSGGLSNFTATGPCSNEAALSRDGQPCCTGEPANRYAELAAQFQFTETESICAPNYTRAMNRAMQPVIAVE